jgi:hypothetical protein
MLVVVLLAILDCFEAIFLLCFDEVFLSPFVSLFGNLFASFLGVIDVEIVHVSTSNSLELYFQANCKSQMWGFAQ